MNYVRCQLAINGILLVVALASIAGVSAFRHSHKQSVSPERAEMVLPCLAEHEPDFLSFAKGGGAVHLIRRASTTDTWFAPLPVNSPGDSARIKEAISALRGMRVIRRIERVPNNTAINLRDLGLEPPAFTWQVGIGGNKLAISFGERASDFRGGRYLMLSGLSNNVANLVYVVDVNSAALDLTPEEVIDSRLVLANDNDIREMVFKSPQTVFHVRKDEDTDHWFEFEPPHSRLDSAKMAQLLTEVRLLKGKHFTNLTQVTPQGGQPSTVLKLVLPDREIEVDVMIPCDDAPGLTVVRVSDHGATVSCADFSALLNLLSQEAERWRDTHLFSLRTDQVESVSTKFRGERTDLRREGTAFTLETKKTVQVDIQAGNELLTVLLAARGQVVTTESPLMHATFSSGDYLQIRSSVIGKLDEYQEKLLVASSTVKGERFVKRLEDAAVLRISEATAELLRLDAQSFKATN